MKERSALIADRRQKRIREQLRDAIEESRVTQADIERDKRYRSIRQFLAIDEVEALLDYVDALERDRESAYAYLRETTEGRPGGV